MIPATLPAALHDIVRQVASSNGRSAAGLSMRTEDQIDYSTLMPSKRRMLRAALFIAAPLLVIGLLLALLVYVMPGSVLAVALGNAFLTGGPSALLAPGSEWLALQAGIVWGGVLVFLVGPFIFVSWLMYQAKKEFNRLQDEQRMKEYRRIYGGKPRQ